MGGTDNNDNFDVRALSQTGVRTLVVAAIGFGCQVGYARMASLGFVGYLSQGVIESVDAWYGLRVVAGLATYAVLALVAARKRSLVTPPLLLVATGAAVAGAILFAIDEAGGYGVAVALLAGCSSSVLMYAWLLELTSLSRGAVVAVTAGGLPVAGAIIMGVPRLDFALSLVVAVFAAFCAGAALLLADRGLVACGPDGPVDRTSMGRIPWFAIIAILACGIVATIAYGIAEHLAWLYDWKPNYPAFGISVVAVVVPTIVIVARDERWGRHVWVPQFVLLVVALACSCFSVREALQLAIGFLLASVFCAHFLHWIVFPAALAQPRCPRALLAAVLLFVANGSLSAMAGDALGSALPHSMQNFGGVAGLAIIVLGVVLVGAHVLNRKLLRDARNETAAQRASDEGDNPASGASAPVQAADPAASVAPAPADSAPAAPSAPADPAAPAAPPVPADPAAPAPTEAEPETLQTRMERLAKEHGLTPREAEVALLTAQGFSGTYIAEKLVVSNSTVRYHQQNSYRKFGVHSRNELIELAGAAETPVQTDS